jgi:hypothetical protein
MALCLSWINKIVPNLYDICYRNGIFIRPIQELLLALSEAKNVAPSELRDLTLRAMMRQSYEKIQHIISAAKEKEIEINLSRSMPQGRATGGLEAMFNVNLSPFDREKDIQHRVNKDPINYAFLTANPCAPMCAMSNQAFCNAIQHRLLLPVGGSRSFCKCGEAVGKFLSHCYRCEEPAIKNPIRNNLHKDLKEKISDILRNRISQSDFNLSRSLMSEEPRLEDFYDLVAEPNASPTPQEPNSTDDDDHVHNYRNEHGVKVRADMGIKHHDQNRTIIVDFTFTEPTSTSNGAYEEVGSAAKKAVERKLREYRRWDTEGSADKLVVFAVETFGVVGKEAQTFLTWYISDNEAQAVVKQLLYQQLSVALHTLRAKQFERIYKEFTDDRRPDPLIARINQRRAARNSARSTQLLPVSQSPAT